MIELTRLNGSKIYVNPFEVEYTEETPDTVVLLLSGRKMVVKEKNLEIQEKFAGFLGNSISKGIIEANSH